mgnify:CR=1 FL=1
MEHVIQLHIEKLPEGLCLATGDDVQGLVTRRLRALGFEFHRQTTDSHEIWHPPTPRANRRHVGV